MAELQLLGIFEDRAQQDFLVGLLEAAAPSRNADLVELLDEHLPRFLRAARRNC